MSTSHTLSTADPKEVAFLEEIDSLWWDEMGPTKILHSMNQVRVPLIQEGLVNEGVVKEGVVNTAESLKNLLILEVGCAGGILSEPLAKLGGNVTGIDPGTKLIEAAKQHAALDPSLANLKYLVETIEEHALNNFEKYDVVVASEVLEHVLNHKIFIEACVKCLKPGGSIFFTTYNKTPISWIGGIIIPEYVLNYVPRGAHEYNKFISPQDTKMILEEYNCETKSIRGTSYNFLTNKWSWAWTALINYGLHAVKH